MSGFYNRPTSGSSGQRFDRGSSPPIDITPRRRGGRPFSSRGLFIILGILAFLLVLFLSSAEFYVDYLWFESLGLQSVFLTALRARFLLFLLGALVVFGFFAGNIYLARFLLIREQSKLMPRAEVIVWTTSTANSFRIAAVLLSLFSGLAISSSWMRILRFLNARPFNSADPIFGQDISFYVFTLPVLEMIKSWLLLIIILTIIGTALVYLSFFLTQRLRPTLTPAIKGHLSALGSLFLLILAWNYQLQTYELLYSMHTALYGASYTDVNARMWALSVLSVVAVISAVLLLVNIRNRGVLLPAASIGFWIIASFLLVGIYPAVVQKFQVEPSELARETPYIQNNISMTRAAFGLDNIIEDTFPANETVTAEQVRQNTSTIENLRLWDYRPLLDTYNQIQSIRLYYEFPDVDIERYTIDGKYRQVMLSVRELSYKKLASQAQNWVNKRLNFTHGYGLVMNFTNEVTREGLPSLIVQDIPPAGKIKIDRPEIYYGERTDEYVFVKTAAPEFDYPKGDDNVYSQYTGESGVKLDSVFKKILFAWSFGDGNIFFTNYLTPESRVLYHRNIKERTEKIAPFLMFDHDPYPVVADGKIYWLHDAYTISSQYPYSMPYRDSFNYVRNSVKIVTDAYDGSISFYVWDEGDPLIQSYMAVFPDLFKSRDQIPEALKPHIRYPEDLFNIQAEMYQTYHMQDITVFYNREDLWSRPREVFNDKEQPIEPYYVIMRLPAEKQEEFVLLLPFTPSTRTNMVAWLGARSDGPNYGKLIVYKFPKDKLVYGPMQIGARINQDPVISSQLTLWDQRGSNVLRGNMIVIPIDKSLLYIEPIYLQAENSQLPELKRIIVASGDRIAMEPTLGESLAKILGTAPPGTTTPTPDQPPTTGSTADIARSAQQHYDKAVEAQKSGDWARYGEELKALENDLNRLVEATGIPQ